MFKLGNILMFLVFKMVYVLFSMILLEILTSYTEIRYMIYYCHCMNGNTFNNNMKNKKLKTNIDCFQYDIHYLFNGSYFIFIRIVRK